MNPRPLTVLLTTIAICLVLTIVVDMARFMVSGSDVATALRQAADAMVSPR